MNGNDFSNGSDTQPISSGGAIQTPQDAAAVVQVDGGNNSVQSAPVALEGGNAEPKESSNGVIDFGKMLIRKLT